jgi:hypothetical protein
VLVWAKTVGVDEQGQCVPLAHEVADMNSGGVGLLTPSHGAIPPGAEELLVGRRSLLRRDPGADPSGGDPMDSSSPHEWGSDPAHGAEPERPLLRDTRSDVLHAGARRQDIEAATHTQRPSQTRGPKGAQTEPDELAARVPRVTLGGSSCTRNLHPECSHLPAAEVGLSAGGVPRGRILGHPSSSSSHILRLSLALDRSLKRC